MDVLMKWMTFSQLAVLPVNYFTHCYKAGFSTHQRFNLHLQRAKCHEQFCILLQQISREAWKEFYENCVAQSFELLSMYITKITRGCIIKKYFSITLSRLRLGAIITLLFCWKQIEKHLAYFLDIPGSLTAHFIPSPRGDVPRQSSWVGTGAKRKMLYNEVSKKH